MKSRLLKLASVLAGSLFALFAVMAFPVLLQQSSVLVPQLASVSDLLIASTLAQTATVATITTDVSTMLTGILPDWLTFILFAVVAALGAFLFGRFLRSAKS